MEVRGSQRIIKFRLFGKFSVTVDGHAAVFPEAAFFTYLKLALLSGDTFFDYNRASETSVPPKLIRDVLDKGNLDRKIAQGGRFAFTQITGLSLRYREGQGIELQGSDWECDLHVFEEIWAEVARAPESVEEDRLKFALALYGSGIDVRSWKRDSVFLQCRGWTKKRLGELQKHKEDIQAELQRRLESKQAEYVARGLGQEDGDGRKWSDNVNCHETSGFDDSEARLDSTEQSSTALGGALCESVQDDSVRVSSDSVGDGDIVGERQSDFDAATGAEAVNVEKEPTHVETSSNSKIEVSEPRRIFLPVAEPRRAVSGAGLTFIAIVALILVGLGFALSRLVDSPASADSASKKAGGNARTNLQNTPLDPVQKNDPSGDPDYKTRAPESPVLLSTRYLEDVAGVGVVLEDDEVVIGHQIFSGYMWARDDGGGETAGVFSLDREFKTLKCLVGVPDSKAWTLETAAKEVVFEGDGQVLKKVRITEGSPVSVEVSVRNVKSLVIVFRQPAVIVGAKVWR